jgi:hypothetical protein
MTLFVWIRADLSQYSRQPQPNPENFPGVVHCQASRSSVLKYVVNYGVSQEKF